MNEQSEIQITPMNNDILDLLAGPSDEPAFLTAEMALPSDHWLYAPQCPDWDTARDTAADLPLPVLADDQQIGRAHV